MGSPVKTTVEIPAELFRKAKAVAAQDAAGAVREQRRGVTAGADASHFADLRKRAGG
jgi:hypothetical protein